MVLQEIFSKIINMAMMASIVVLIVLLIRSLLKKAPRKVIYGLWIIVAVRLIIPDMFPTSFSIFNIINNTNTTGSHTYDNTTNISTNLYPTDKNLETNAPMTNNDANSNHTTSFKVSILNHTFNLPAWSIPLWLFGMGIFLIYFLVLYILLSKKVRYATLIFDTDACTKAYYCENISTPFVFGILRPRIYIPYGIKDINLELILQHEQYHIRKGDHLSKVLAFMLLAVYWFCPFVWIAYFLSQKDMELRCDEAILKNAGMETRKCYSNALLAFAGNNRKYLLSPVAFSENGTKERIKLSLKARKISVFATLIAIVAVIIVAAVCLTDNKIKDYNIPYGRYMADDLSYISIKAYGISQSHMAKSCADVYYNYTKKDNIIYTKDNNKSYTIKIKNNSTLILDNKEYTLELTYDEKEAISNDILASDIPNTPVVQYGIYETKDSMKMRIEITKDTIIDLGSPWQSRGPIEYEYTIKDNIIYATNDFGESTEIEIVNSIYLKQNNQIYTYTVDDGVDIDLYINELTDDDINSAIEFAREYYSNYERIDSIQLSSDEYFWKHSIEEYNYVPGYMIVIESEVVWGGNLYPGTRWMTLYKSSETDNQWTLLNEGK